MPSPLENAKRKLAQLREEVARVERFISDYQEFSSDESASSPGLMNGDRGEGNVSVKASVQAVDKLWPERPRMRPDEIAKTIERVIREIGHPMTRGQLVDALERRDIELPAADKARYLGTIIWRHKKVFENIEGRGYWLKNQSQAKAPSFERTDPLEDELY